MPTVGRAPSSGILSTGREPHAIPGVTLPFAVILTAHRLHPSLHPAQQTALGLVSLKRARTMLYLIQQDGANKWGLKWGKSQGERMSA